jgi:hypothetical protein
MRSAPAFAGAAEVQQIRAIDWSQSEATAQQADGIGGMAAVAEVQDCPPNCCSRSEGATGPILEQPFIQSDRHQVAAYNYIARRLCKAKADSSSHPSALLNKRGFP